MGFKQERELIGTDAFLKKYAGELEEKWNDYTISYWGERQGRIWRSGLTGRWQCAIETHEIVGPMTARNAILLLMPESETKEEAIDRANRWYVENWMGRYE